MRVAATTHACSSRSPRAGRAPTHRACFGFGTEPPFASRFVDSGVAVRGRVGRVIDAVAVRVDVAFDIAAVALPLLRSSVARVASLALLAAVGLGRRELAGPDAAP